MTNAVRACLLVALHVLALPTRIVFWALRSVRSIREYRALASGVVHCRLGHRNELDILGRCRRCNLVSLGNRLFCRGCGLISRGFNCDHCGHTIVLLSES